MDGGLDLLSLRQGCLRALGQKGRAAARQEIFWHAVVLRNRQLYQH